MDIAIKYGRDPKERVALGNEIKGIMLEAIERALALPIPDTPAVPARVPEGFKLVPTEITLEMQHAYFNVIEANMDRVKTDARFGRYDNNRLGYRAMLAAAPARAGEGGDVDDHC